MLHAAEHKSVSLLLMLAVFALSLAHQRAAPDVQGALRLPGCSLLLVSNLFITLKHNGHASLPTHDIQLRSPWNQWSCFRCEYLQGNR